MAANPLQSFVTELGRLADPDRDPEDYPRLAVVEVEGDLHVDFHGSPFDEPFCELCALLTGATVAPRLGSLALSSPKEEGSNGTRNWDLGQLVSGGVDFPVLRSVAVEQNAAGDHNRVIVAAGYAEEGVLGRLLARAPALQTLTVPSAPDASFFALERHPLRYLSVDAGYDTQGFIGNLARSHCFPELSALEFGEYNETYMDDFPSQCTPFSDYVELFRSPAFAGVRAFTWRNPVCSEAQLTQLRGLRPRAELQLQVVRFSAQFL